MKINLPLKLLVAFVAFVLFLVAAVQLYNRAAGDAQAQPGPLDAKALGTPSQDPSELATSGPLDLEDAHEWTLEEMEKAQPYPMPMLPGSPPSLYEPGTEPPLEGTPVTVDEQPSGQEILP